MKSNALWTELYDAGLLALILLDVSTHACGVPEILKR